MGCEALTLLASPKYVGPMDSDQGSHDERPETPIEVFLEQPAFHADEDSAQLDQEFAPGEVAGNFWQRFRRKFSRFMFEKNPSQYSSIAPRTPDGKRTKLFFFNGNGRGR